jgi:small subunit ribosomal protein S16
MALKIRLARGGSKKRPFYRLVVAENTAPRDGRFVERLGSYNPLIENGKDGRVVANADRVKHWLSVGAKATERAEKLLAYLEIVPQPSIRITPKKSAPKKKAQERMKASRELQQ